VLILLASRILEELDLRLTAQSNSGAAISVGGPYLTMKLIPTQEELFKRYNPDLQKRSLENKDKREQEFDDFVSMIKQASKSDKHSMVLPFRPRSLI